MEIYISTSWRQKYDPKYLKKIKKQMKKSFNKIPKIKVLNEQEAKRSAEEAEKILENI